ncbi:hypothetical protein IE81DRAFT_272985, partial [Ceraceosorus guamensis]
SSHSRRFALPAPDEQTKRELRVGGPDVKLDQLGPVVINTDGSISRINNWEELSEAERATTLRLLAKRNAERVSALK